MTLCTALARVAAGVILAALLTAARGEDGPRVEISTNLGDVVVELRPDKAPATVARFLHLAETGFYDGTIFHRVIPGFMVQGGGFTPEYAPREAEETIENEADNGLSNVRGTLAMARTEDPHSARNQFFVNLADNTFLDHSSRTRRGWGYAVFGQVVAGMEVIDRIAELPTGAAGPFTADAPEQPVIIKRIRRIHEEQGDERET